MSKKVVVTHSGGYHSDDLFAVATLEILLGDIEIVRSREKEDFDRADYIVDVGGEYDPVANRFDHHQPGGAGERENGVPHASFGLVWKKFGEELAGGPKEAKKVDERLVQPIDAGDNGYEIYNLTSDVQPYTIQNVFGIFQPTWNEDKKDDQLFIEMLPLARRILSREIDLAKQYVQAENEIDEIYREAENKELIIFPENKDYGRNMIWSVFCKYDDTKFTISYQPDKDAWQVLAMKKELGSFELKKPIPLEWGGTRTSEELKELTGLDDLIFIHKNGFMALAQTKEAAVELAKLALGK